MFPWANFRKNKGAVRLHTLLDLKGSIPSFIHISDGKLHEVNTLDIIPLEAGAFYIMDRGYLDFDRLYNISLASAFLPRSKKLQKSSKTLQMSALNLLQNTHLKSTHLNLLKRQMVSDLRH
jgi:hypothetical protein